MHLSPNGNPTRLRSFFLATSLAVALTASATGASEDGGSEAGPRWPQFRGVNAGGVDDRKPLPVLWDVEEGEGVAWKTAVAGLSHASPIVWDDRIYVVTAVATGVDPELKVGLYGAGDSADDMVEHSFRLISLDRQTGEVAWDRQATLTLPQFARHTKATHANSTPATDGDHIVALFGSEGLFCFDRDGTLLWNVDTGPFDAGPWDALELEWGYASSPIIADGLVIVQADVKESPHLSAYDLETGEEVWRTDRDDLVTWSTPTLLPAAAAPGGVPMILVNGCKHLGGYRLLDGTEVWRMAGGGGIPVPTPVVADGLVYFTSNHRPIEPSHPLKPIFAVQTTAQGDLGVPVPQESSEHVAWAQSRYGTYMQTPLIYRGRAFFGKDEGVVSVFDALTGELLGSERLGTGSTGFSASPVAGDGKIYFTGESGTIFVLAADETLEVLEMCWMDEVCMATPAIADGQLLFRTRSHVVAIAAPDQER